MPAQLQDTLRYPAFMLSWDDMRVALAVHEHGTLTRAGRALGIDPTTVGRRITALEASLGVPIFLRLSQGWQTTEPGERVLVAATQAAHALRRAERVAHEDEPPSGVVRVTAMESVASQLLTRVMPSFARRWPLVSVDVICTTRTLDLHRGEADIALRVGRPRRPELVARRLTTLREHLYASTDWLTANGYTAKSLESLDGVPLLQVGGRDPELLVSLGDYRVVLRSNSVTTVAQAARAGVGVALLPDLVAEPHPELVALTAFPPRDELPLWLVTHKDVLRIPRVRVLVDAIASVSL